MEALELIVDEGKPSAAGRFFELGADLLALLDELSDLPVPWRIEDLRLGSAVVRLAAPPRQAEQGRWLRVTVDALAAVRGGAGLPEEWSPDAVKVAHRFVEHGLPAEEATDWVAPRLVLLTDTRPEREVSLTSDLASRLADLQPFERRMPGAVRGTLVGLNVSRGNRASLRTPSGRIVRVGFDSALRVELKDALYQPVELRGQVRQDGDGRTFHVKAEEVDALVRPGLSWSDLFGIDPDFTGDMTTAEYLEASRGDA